jgi:predicted  nucleic acid-binding Zn-ribbon protein
MNSDLHHLIRLQQLDSQFDHARRRIAEIPVVQDALEARLAQYTAVVVAVKQRLADSQAARREIEKEVAAIETRLSKYKDQLMAVKTNKEYQAMQKEIATAEEGVRAQEDHILERMVEGDALASELKHAEAELKRQQADISKERQALGEEAARLEQQASSDAASRDGIAGELSKPALQLFEHVSRQRKGLAVAEVRDGVCTVCHVRLRPQIYNEVRRADALIQCESCLRILYHVPAAGDTASSQV